MAHEVLMPKLSSTMSEGTITEWFKSEGDLVEVGDPIFEVMTDKIAIEVEAYEAGILLKRYISEDESAPINAVIAYIGEKDETVPASLPTISHDGADLEMCNKERPSIEKEERISAANVEEKPRATPAARRLARERGIFLTDLRGSGRGGRIHVEDVRGYQPPSAPATFPSSMTETVIPWKGMRKIIADNMVKSKMTAPHVTLHAVANMKEVVALREKLLPTIEIETGLRLSYTDIFVKIIAMALLHHPKLNAWALEDGIHQFTSVNMGLAVSLEDGLVVPVIPRAEKYGLQDLCQIAKDLAGKARQGTLCTENMNGATFTISSLGQTPVRTFTSIINVPEVAILGIGTIYDQVVLEGEIPLNRPMIGLSLSIDHRAVAGADAGAFLKTVVEFIENPALLLL